MDVVRKITYTDCLPQVQSKITLIHAYTDTVFSPMCSTQLANMLTQYNINNHVAITKIFDHADLIPKNLPKEFFIILKALNH